MQLRNSRDPTNRIQKLFDFWQFVRMSWIKLLGNFRTLLKHPDPVGVLYSLRDSWDQVDIEPYHTLSVMVTTRNLETSSHQDGWDADTFWGSSMMSSCVHYELLLASVCDQTKGHGRLSTFQCRFLMFDNTSHAMDLPFQLWRGDELPVSMVSCCTLLIRHISFLGSPSPGSDLQTWYNYPTCPYEPTDQPILLSSRWINWYKLLMCTNE